MQLFFPPVAEQHPLLPNSVHIVVDNWLAEFYFGAIVNPCVIFVIAQAGRQRQCLLGMHVFILVSHAFGHYITLFIIEGMKVVDLLCKAELFQLYMLQQFTKTVVMLVCCFFVLADGRSCKYIFTSPTNTHYLESMLMPQKQIY